ncbi:hypothetical protein, partial [Pseudomonas syringae group genomosp. 3]|uniref:hypothetical protein n=2 Tax=Pseudomonas syringae group TaxID=136849 RepID=UPI001C7F5C5B
GKRPMATLIFCDFDDALEAIQNAPTKLAVANVIDQIDQQFEAGSLDVTPSNWAHLASAVLVRSDSLTQ